MSKVNRRKKYVVMVMGCRDAYAPFGEYVCVFTSPVLEKKYNNIVIKGRPSDFKVGDIMVVRRSGGRYDLKNAIRALHWTVWEVVDE